MLTAPNRSGSRVLSCCVAGAGGVAGQEQRQHVNTITIYVAAAGGGEIMGRQ